MSMYPLIKVLQPEPFDIVDQRVLVAGVGTGFEGTIEFIVRDGNGGQLTHTLLTAHGAGVRSNFHIGIQLQATPPTPNGFVEVFDAGGAEVPPALVVVPVVFGSHLVDRYVGFRVHTVQPGDTLFAIAQEAYGDGNLFPRIFEANRNQIADPNLIVPGQTLRIPEGSAGP